MMVGNFPRLFVVSEKLTSPPHQTLEAEGPGMRVLGWVREAFCGLRGHDSLMQFRQDRLFLKCVSCGHESPGWELNGTPPRLVAQAGTRRQALVPRLIGERRIA
jgi:hypothetical protein